MAETSRVVVGVGTSPASRAAVEWAAGVARALDRELWLLHARGPAEPGAFPAVPRGDDLSEALPGVLGDDLGDRAPRQVHRDVVPGPAASVLLEATRATDLLVLGRSQHRVAGWPVPGSLTRRILDQAPCPVVLVPENGAGGDRAASV